QQELAYERMEDEAAFYGPKIDIKVKDSIGRLWQLTTVQFDFNLPKRFQLEYIGEDNKPHQPITDRINEYAGKVAADLRAAGLRVEVNLRNDKIGAKIRDAQLQKVPFMLVLGDREMQDDQVAVRERLKGDLGAMSLNEFEEMARRLVETRALTNG